MKVLMKRDLNKVGKRGEIVDVSDGYGANYIIPRGYGVLYTDSARKEYERELAKEREIEREKAEKAREVAKKLEDITLEFEAPAGRRGDMIGTVSNKEIIEALKKKHDIAIDKKMIVDKDVIVNGFGTTTIKVELFKGVFGQVKVHVSLKEKK